MITTLVTPPFESPLVDAQGVIVVDIWRKFLMSLAPHVAVIQIDALVTATYKATLGQTILVDATAAAMTIVLPVPRGRRGIIVVKKVDATVNTVTINGNGAIIDGLLTQVIAVRYKGFAMQPYGANWFITAVF